jgi:hypothetical protein
MGSAGDEGAMATRYVVDFGSVAVAHDFVNAIADLGHRSAAAGSRVTITEATVAGLRQRPADSDGAIQDEPWSAPAGGDEGSMPHVRMGSHTYPVWPESAGPKIATRRPAEPHSGHAQNRRPAAPGMTTEDALWEMENGETGTPEHDQAFDHLSGVIRDGSPREIHDLAESLLDAISAMRAREERV